jgi:hypothetical protein
VIATVQQEGLKGWIDTFVTPVYACNGVHQGVVGRDIPDCFLLEDYINEDNNDVLGWEGYCMWMVSC